MEVGGWRLEVGGWRLEVLGQVGVLDTDNGQCRICSLKYTSMSSEEEDEASGTLGYTPMKVVSNLNIGFGRQCHQSDWLILRHLRVLALLHNQIPQSALIAHLQAFGPTKN